MPKKQYIEFFEVTKPITEFVTKFAGQPKWLQQVEWPLSKTTGEPMRFIGQIVLDPELFGRIPGQMAYVFMTDDADVDGTWEANGGENALIIQPGRTEIKTEPIAKGPTLYRMVKKFFGAMNFPQTLEYGVRLIPGQDPNWMDEVAKRELPEEQLKAYIDSLGGNKIGGVPGFLQNDAFPDDGPWKLVFQLDAATVPFWVNFGDAGIGYGFISEDGSRGKFLWQCC